MLKRMATTLVNLCAAPFYTLPFMALYGYACLRFQGGEKRTYLGKRLRFLLLRLGPVYVKIGQIMATRGDFLAEEILCELRTLQDQAPCMKPKDVEAILEAEYRRPLSEVFARFDLTPLASASIAQVHAAVLTNGRKVAVKIVKKGIRERLRDNLRLLGWLIALAHYSSRSVRQWNILARFRELEQLLISQTDMLLEASNQSELCHNFDNHPYVRIPALVPELSNTNILVMDFVEGIPGNQAHAVGLSPGQLARRFQDSIYAMLYMDGICHGDPHPGNVFFSPDGKIIFIDFGIVVRLSEDEKWGLSSFYFACSRREWDLAVDRFTEHFVVCKHNLTGQWHAYREDMKQALLKHFGEQANRWSTIAYCKDVSRVLSRYGAAYTPNFAKVELVFLSCEGFAAQIDPQIDIWENARRFTDRYSPFMSQAVMERFDEYFSKHSPISMAYKQRAANHLIAPTHIDRYFFPSAYPVFVRRAKGSKIEDFDGNVYVDLSCGYGPHILGYAHPTVVRAVSEALAQGCVNALGHVAEVELAEMLVRAFPGMDKAIFCNSGTESVLQAIRLCRAYRRRDKIAKFEGHYHGFSDQGMVSSWFRFTGDKRRPQPMAGTLGTALEVVRNTLVMQYGDEGGLSQLYEYRDQLACVICEPMPTTLAKYDQPFLRALRRVCDEIEVPLIFDEVVSGFRVAYGGAQAIVEVTPDLTCLGKIIGGGLPCGAIVGKAFLIDLAKTSGDPFVDYESKVFVGGTMSGNRLSCAAGLAVLTHLRGHPGIYTRLTQQTVFLAEYLKAVAADHGIAFQVSANHSIFSITFSHRSPCFYREKQAGSNFKANLALAYYMRKKGVYMPELHTMLLSSEHSDEDLKTVVAAFSASLDEMSMDGFFAQ